jgi:hypothetical protein
MERKSGAHAPAKSTPTPLGWVNHPDGYGKRIVGARFHEHEACEPHMLSLPDEMRRRWNAFDPLVSALEGLVEIIDAAGVHNIMRGVPLGSVSWAVKTNDRLDAARAALSLAKDGTK